MVCALWWSNQKNISTCFQLYVQRRKTSLTRREKVLYSTRKWVLRCETVVHGCKRDENGPNPTPFKLTEDAPVYLTSIALDAVTLDEELCKPSQGDCMRQEELTVPGPHCQSNSRLGHTTSTDNRPGMRGSIPPWAYRIHLISSISGWYGALSLGDSFFFEAAP